MKTKQLAAFIAERQSVLINKNAGLPKPWTKDKILQRYRFCNVNREDDTVTKWVYQNWLGPNYRLADNWFASAVARWINWPETLACFGYPIPWEPTYIKREMKLRRAAGGKIWTGAYMIGTQGNAKDKIDFIIDDVLSPMYKNRELLRPRKGDSLFQFNCRLQSQYAMKGGFMGGQVIADIKDFDKHLREASDWHTFAISGPGSRRGLNRVIGKPLDEKLTEKVWHNHLRMLQDELTREFNIDIHAQNLQNCLCEFDKYERVRLGEGRPRSLYPGVMRRGANGSIADHARRRRS